MARGGASGLVMCAQACGSDGLQITLRNKDAVNKVGFGMVSEVEEQQQEEEEEEEEEEQQQEVVWKE
ncbi:hypothetical protein Q7C36_020517 [Tachysurus vachellii]|uniref:Uncharacterized protein n=1 Tax=Tachysurus vachellii TaxID=175792 RepID=A0AA88IVZ8_TACVA|nr:hypothetical protein Q7C36_020517 [Tachysurus vachellii]